MTTPDWQMWSEFMAVSGRRARGRACLRCFLVGAALAALAWAVSVQAHRDSDPPYADHDPAMCQYADLTRRGGVACSDPAANPCESGVGVHAGAGSHAHAAYPPGKRDTPACVAFRTPPPACTDRIISPWSAWTRNACPTANTRSRTCTDGTPGTGTCTVSCAGVSLTETRSNPCPDPNACTDRTISPWTEWTRNACPTDNTRTRTCTDGTEGEGSCVVSCEGVSLKQTRSNPCPDPDPDPDPPEQCECCEDVLVTKIPGESCKLTCESLLRQIPDACPAPKPDPEDGGGGGSGGGGGGDDGGDPDDADDALEPEADNPQPTRVRRRPSTWEYTL